MSHTTDTDDPEMIEQAFRNVRSPITSGEIRAFDEVNLQKGHLNYPIQRQSIVRNRLSNLKERKNPGGATP